MRAQLLLLSFLAAVTAESYLNAVDISAPASLDTFKCLQKNDYRTVFVRAYRSDGQGSFDENSIQNLNNAFKAGLASEVIMVPQPNSDKNAFQQVNEFYQGLSKAGFNIRSVWLQLSDASTWPKNTAMNVYYIKTLQDNLRSWGLTTGFYTNEADWKIITNNADMGDHLLWYWNVKGNGSQGETAADYKDFAPFGGFSSAIAKQYGQNENICGMYMNRDIYNSNMPFLAQHPETENGRIVVGERFTHPKMINKL